MSGEITGGSAHQPQDSTSEASTFNIQIVPAGSAPKSKTHQPNVDGERAPGQPNNSADTTYDKATEGSKTDVHKGLGGKGGGDDGEGKGRKRRDGDEDGSAQESGRAEIKSASEMEPEVAGSY